MIRSKEYMTRLEKLEARIQGLKERLRTAKRLQKPFIQTELERVVRVYVRLQESRQRGGAPSKVKLHRYLDKECWCK